MEQKLLWKVYIGVVGAVTTIAAQKIVTTAWKVATGDAPPSPTNPDTPVKVAVSWAIASGVGVGVTQLLVTRLAARRWSNQTGAAPSGIPGIKLKI
ncbi:DUF4235 domain-containing protein [Microlunatus parietis]|uniref:DUF4235 domain-containing protein n=1 Tax=Microlunatus parietis TaxID=682979 RepID=A0A7Y9IES6_9ACTN|nr:DUF4235 domain-containing protein [Microlunatus parietis]NYE75537.1 hypothetical protein [Microlunatus parietis]